MKTLPCRLYTYYIVILLHLLTATLRADNRPGHISGHISAIPQLHQSHISNLQQDGNGFIWFATWNGLIRYDGHTTHSFKPIQCSEGTIDSNRIYNIKISTTGDIWCVSSDNRLFLFSPDSFTFTNLSSAIPQFDGRKVNTLTPLKNGYTWVTMRDGTCARLNDTVPLSDIRCYISPDCLVNGASSVTAISLAENGDEWVLTDSGALNYTSGRIYPGRYRYVESLYKTTYLIAYDGLVMRPADSRRYPTPLPAESTVSYVRTDAHRIVMASDRGIASVDTRDSATLRYTSSPSTYLFKDSRHRLWGFGPQPGVTIIPDPATPRSSLITPATGSDKTPVKNPQLIFETASGDILLRPTGGVLSFYDETSGTLDDVTFSTTPSGCYDRDAIKKYIADRTDNLWILHSEGSDIINFDRRTFTHTTNRSLTETRALATDSHGRLWTSDRSGLLSCGVFSHRLPSPAYTISESPDGQIWVGTKGDGVYVLAPTSDQAVSYNVTHLSRHTLSENRRIHSDSIYAIAFDNDLIWLGSYGSGLARGKAAEGGWQFDKVAGQPDGMKIRRILPYGKGHLLIATADGLVTTDAPVSERPSFFVNKFRNEPWGLKGNDIMGLAECYGRYYACVFGSGLSRIDSDSLLTADIRFTTFDLPATAEAGQISTAVSTGNEIWIAAGSTLTRFSPADGHMHTVSCDSPSDRITFSEATPALSDNGDIVLGTTDGVITFTPTLPSPTASSLPPVVTGIQYQNDKRVIPLNNPASLVITPDRRSFTLLLSAMDYDGVRTARLRYRMEGLDVGWTYLHGPQPTATYNNIPPGEYVLNIQRENPDGSPSDTGSRVSVSVTPTFTETIWFRLTIVFMLVALLLGLTAAIIYFKRMRNALQRKYSLLMTVNSVSERLYRKTAAAEKPAVPTPREDNTLFIEASLGFLNDNIDNVDLMVEDFARHLGMSRTAYYNRMKEAAGVSPVDFIRQMRIKRALKLLEEGKHTIAEVAYMTGFADPKYFSRCFKAEMSMTPTQYIAAFKAKK